MTTGSHRRPSALRQVVGEAATLVSGNLLAQIIAMGAYLVLTRIYTPEDYGLFNIFYSYIEVLIILSTCKYEVAIVAADSVREAALVARGTLRMNTIFSLILLTVALALSLTHCLPGKMEQIGYLALLIPPMVFFCGTTRVYSFLYNRARRYKQIALSETVNSATGAGMKIVLGLMGMHGWGMPLGTVIGQAAANINYRLRLKRLPFRRHPDGVTAQERHEVMRRHRNYPLYVAPKELAGSFSANLPFLWVAFYFDRAEVGLFGLALMVTFRSANLINSAFERVLFPRVKELVQGRMPVMPMLRRFLLGLNAVAIPVAIMGGLFAEPLFTFLFGAKWVGTGVYVRALLPWIVLMLSSLSLMFIPNIFGTQRTEFLISLGQLALRIVVLAVGIRAGDFVLAIRLFAAVSALTSLVLLGWYLWQVRRYDRSLVD